MAVAEVHSPLEELVVSHSITYKCRQPGPNMDPTYLETFQENCHVAPEWYLNLAVTVKIDVYSFGIVLLEIICCRRCMDQNFPDNQIVLQDWVYQCFDAGDLRQLVRNEEVDLKQLERMIKVALWCILDEPSVRPSMKKVLLMLEGSVEIPIPPSSTSFVTLLFESCKRG